MRKRKIPILGKKWLKAIREYRGLRSEVLLKYYVHVPDFRESLEAKSVFGLLCEVAHENMEEVKAYQYLFHIPGAKVDSDNTTPVTVYKSINSDSSVDPPADLLLFLGLKTVDKLDIKAAMGSRLSYNEIADIIEWRLMKPEREGHIMEKVHNKLKMEHPRIVRYG